MPQARANFPAHNWNFHFFGGEGDEIIQALKNINPCVGYLGDKIGYNTVLVVNLLGCALAQTALDWTPRFYEHHRVPTLSVLQNETFQADEIFQFVWPLQCNATNVTIEDCKMNADG